MGLWCLGFRRIEVRFAHWVSGFAGDVDSLAANYFLQCYYWTTAGVSVGSRESK